MVADAAALGAPRADPSSAQVAIAWHTARRAVRSGVAWGYVFGVVVASSALTYTRIYKTPADRAHLASAFGANNASAALFGPGRALDTVRGFTAFKVSMTLMIVGAVWGLLTSTRLLRGEEDAGRWELLLAGATTRSRAALQAVAGLGAGALVLWLLTALITAVVGRASTVAIGVGAAGYLALALVAPAVMFLAVGALTSQLAGTRRQAAGYAAGFLGASYGIRMVADSGAGLHWLLWASPLGWVEELRPLTDSRPLALVPMAAFVAAGVVGAIHLAGARDLGSSTWPSRDARPPRLGLLGNSAGLTLRLVRPTALAWWAAIAGTGLVLGFVAKSAGASITGSSVQQVFSRLGSPGTGVTAFLGVSFLIVAVLVALVAAGQAGAARTEEAAGRLEPLFAAPVSRTSWLLSRTAVALTLVVGAGAVAGLCTWLGALAGGSSLALATMVDAGLNVAAPAVCILGLGVLAFGYRPRLTSAAAHGLVIWSLLVELVGGFTAQSHLLLDTSLFHQMASAPAVAPDWATDAIMVGLGLVGMALGVAGFRRRDLEGE